MPKIKIELTNRFAKFYCDPEDQKELKKFFRFHPPGYEFSPAYNKEWWDEDEERFIRAWDGYANLLQRGKVGTGLFLEKLGEIKKAGYKIILKDSRKMVPTREVDFSSKTRPYQKAMVTAMIAAGKGGGIILAATGTGKTFTIGEYFRFVDGNVCMIVSELTLLHQGKTELEEVTGEKVGIVGNQKFDPQRITMATRQTLERHLKNKKFRKWFESLIVIVVDEFHLEINKGISDVLRKVKPLAVFGGTATLQMEKEHIWMPAVNLAGPVIHTYSIQDAVKEGYLAKGRQVFLEFRSAIPATGDYQTDYFNQISHNRKRNDCLEALIREGYARGRRIIVVLERLRHLSRLSRRLEDIPHAVLSGKNPQTERTAAQKKMEAGKLRVIIASRIFSTGINIRSVNMIIDGTGGLSENSAVQRYGRGVRPAKDKDFIHIDIQDLGAFKRASRSRRYALLALGEPYQTLKWNGNPKTIF